MPENERFDERLIDPAPPIPRDYVRKAYFLGQFLDGSGLPADPQWGEKMANAQAIVRNHSDQYPDDSEFHRTLLAHLTLKHDDPFKVEYTAARLADSLFYGTQQVDMFDLMLAVRTYGILSAETVASTEAFDEERLNRDGILRRAFIDEAVSRVDPRQLDGEAVVNLHSLYERVFKDRDYPSVQDLSAVYLTEAQLKVKDHLIINEMIVKANLFGPNISLAVPYRQNFYNSPMTDKERNDLNNGTADIIEKLHLLKAYPVAPLVVPSCTIGLPWDILLMPPLDKKLEAYDEGCVADFYFTPPAPEHANAQLSIVPPEDSWFSTLVVGNELPQMRFRLHDNGQISFGRLFDNVPNDSLEGIFTYTQSHDSFVRMRGLFVSLAFDALAPDDVVRDRVGGSVASFLSRHMGRQDGSDPFLKMVLSRVRELNRQKITPKSRRPRDWPEPIRSVGGYRRKLPEGTRARPTAEAEAREYFQSINVNFEYLKSDENFVTGYKCGAGPEKVTFRHASFRDSSQTKRFLGSTGLKKG